MPIVNGGLLQTPFVDYLIWRRMLNPSRFDVNHPNVARVFSQLEALPTISAATSTGVVLVPGPEVEPVTPVVPAAQVITPEPGSFAMASIMLGLLAAWSFRRGSH